MTLIKPCNISGYSLLYSRLTNFIPCSKALRIEFCVQLYLITRAAVVSTLTKLDIY